MSDSELPATAGTDLPERHVTMNQVVAYNMASFRRAAGLTQEELGELLGGWSPASVSAAERSWDSSRVKKFDADELFAIAEALVVPLPALFLPPEDDGVAFDYLLDTPRGAVSLRAGLPLIFGAFSEGSLAMKAYRRRLIAAGWHYRLEDSRRSAAPAERDAEDRQHRALADLEAQREELQQRIDDLRAFERDYRTRMKAFLDGQLRAFWAPAERLDIDQAVEFAHRQAAERGVGTVTAVLLGDDGTYDVVRSDQAEGTTENLGEAAGS